MSGGLVIRSLGTAALMLALVTPAQAQQAAGDIPLDTFKPAMDSRGYLTVNASQVLGHKEFSFGLGALDWGYKMLGFGDQDACDSGTGMPCYQVNNMITATLIAAFGLKLGPAELELGASVPFVIMGGDRGPNSLGDPATPNDDMEFKLDGQGIGNVGLHLKTRFLKTSRPPHLGIGVIASVYLPTTNPEKKWLGDTKPVPQIIGIIDKEFGSKGQFRVALNGGIRLRRTTTFMDTGEGGAPATMGSITTSTALPVGAAAAYGVVRDKVELVAEVFGAVPLGRSDGYQPLEALGGVKVYLARSSYLSLGAGRGLLPDRAGNPDFRGVIGIVFEPRPAQRAAAHVPEQLVAEAPPAKHEDPLLDTDNDGIFDRDDHCIDVMEDYDGVEDEDGCPDRERIVETETAIVPLQPIEFEFDKDVLRDSAYPILDEVVQALRDNPDITLVEIEGHTDEQGRAAYNLDLSKRRAATVLRYLVEHGIDSLRLTSEGYGETRPVDPRHTQEAYRINRRVAFSIKQRR